MSLDFDKYTNTMVYPTYSKSDKSDMYREACRVYGEETSRLEALFRKDLETENGITGHPKADVLYAKAWSMGHSGGLKFVQNHYEDLMELLK